MAVLKSLSGNPKMSCHLSTGIYRLSFFTEFEIFLFVGMTSDFN